MSMSVSTGSGEQAMCDINTTPLVDVMLVLLIIFLITIPAITHTVPVALPKETNIPTTTKPQNIIIEVDANGKIYWDDHFVPDRAALRTRLAQRATEVPQPEVHIRADINARYEFIGQVVTDCQREAIQKVAFITEPQHGGS